MTPSHFVYLQTRLFALMMNHILYFKLFMATYYNFVFMHVQIKFLLGNQVTKYVRLNVYGTNLN